MPKTIKIGKRFTELFKKLTLALFSWHTVYSALKIHQIYFQLGLRPRPRWRNWRRFLSGLL